MSTKGGRLRRLRGLFDARTLRERVMLLVALLVVFQLIWSLWLWEPLMVDQGRVNTALEQGRNNLKLMETSLRGVVRRSEHDPNQSVKEDIARVESALEQLEQRTKSATETLIEPREMARLLEKMLREGEGVTLLKLETLATESLLLNTDDQAEEQQKDQQKSSSVNLYRHGFQIEFEGDYFSTLNYLKALEGLPWRFFWDSVELESLDYPVTRVRLELHTLSLSEGWIGV